MQFTTVRSKEKDYDIYLKSEKLVHSQQEHEKNVSQLFGSGKNWFLAICYLQIRREKKVDPAKTKKCSSLLQGKRLFGEQKKVDPCYFGDQKMQFTTVRSKEKDYDIYLKSEKLVHSQQEHEKNVSQLFGSGKNWFLAISSLTNTVAAISRRETIGSLLFGYQKMQFTTVRSKEKDYDIYLKSEKLVHSQQEHEKYVSQLFESGKKEFQAISSLQNTVAVIWRQKKVDPCYLLFVRSKEKEQDILKSEKLVYRQQDHEKNVSQLFGSGKNSAISSLTNTVTAIWREKKVDPCYFQTKKCSSQLLGARKKIMTSI